MTKTELEILQKLREKPDTKGVPWLDRFIWLNTTKPKYEIGEYHLVSNPGSYIAHIEILDMRAKLTGVIPESSSSKYKYICEILMTVYEGTSSYTAMCTTVVYEENIGELVDDNFNTIKFTNKFEEESDI